MNGIFYDSKAAFPSVCHGSLLDMMKAIRMPIALATFIQNLYENNMRSIISVGSAGPVFTFTVAFGGVVHSPR